MLKKIHIPHREPKNFNMINVGYKSPTSRIAIAYGKIQLTQQAYFLIKKHKLPKGDVLALAEVAAILGAKKTPEIIPMCHTLLLDEVTSYFVLDEKNFAIEVYCQAAAHAKTGVEMEALAGVNAALLTIWDLTKAIEPNLMLNEIKLLVKIGGKSGTWINPNGIPDWLQKQLSQTQSLNPIKIAIVIIEQNSNQDKNKDQSSDLLQQKIKNIKAQLVTYQTILNEAHMIKSTIDEVCNHSNIDLIITSKKAHLEPSHITLKALSHFAQRKLIELDETLPQKELHFINAKWLSNLNAEIFGKTLMINLPGGVKVIDEYWNMIEPFIRHALKKIKTQSFEVQHAI